MTGTLGNVDRGPSLLMRSGRTFYPLDPKPDEFEWTDVAAGVAATARYSGQTSKLAPGVVYTVAQHEVLGAWLAPPEIRKAYFHHDDVEGIWGLGDPCGPVKRGLQIASVLKPFERLVERAIAAKAGLPAGFSELPEVKAVDHLMAAWEDRDLRGLARRRFDLPVETLEPWSGEYAYRRWMETLTVIHEGCDCPPGLGASRCTWGTVCCDGRRTSP